jgi:hypothetical protein
MRSAYLLLPLVILLACTTTTKPRGDTQAVRDYIEVGELEDVEHIRTFSRDSMEYVSDYYILYKARTSEYLIEFKRVCREFRENRTVAPDRRYDYNRLRTNEDTIRGCRIGKIYPLTRAQADELRNLGYAPGAGN